LLAATRIVPYKPGQYGARTGSSRSNLWEEHMSDSITATPRKTTLSVHPTAELFQAPITEDCERLKEDIRKHGQRVPIVLTSDGRILDGVSREPVHAGLAEDAARELREQRGDRRGIAVQDDRPADQEPDIVLKLSGDADGFVEVDHLDERERPAQRPDQGLLADTVVLDVTLGLVHRVSLGVGMTPWTGLPKYPDG
jgi:hypothetical protein